MTTIQEHIEFPSSSYSPSDYISGTSSPLDFPSIHYKDSLRHRSELAKKGRSRATQSYLQKKKKQIDTEERILRKQEERRKNRSDEEGNESEKSEEDQDEQTEEENVDTKTEEKDSDEDDDNNSRRSRRSKSKTNKKSTSASRQGYKSNKSGDESEDRSNKRVSRRTRPEDIDLSLPSPTNSDDSSDDSDDNNNTVEPEELIQEIEEHFKFKRNLNFKTDDEGEDGLYVSGKTNATQLTSREWKQVIERRLDVQDKSRNKDKKNKKGGKSGKHL